MLSLSKSTSHAVAKVSFRPTFCHQLQARRFPVLHLAAKWPALIVRLLPTSSDSLVITYKLFDQCLNVLHLFDRSCMEFGCYVWCCKPVYHWGSVIVTYFMVLAVVATWCWQLWRRQQSFFIDGVILLLGSLTTNWTSLTTFLSVTFDVRVLSLRHVTWWGESG